MRRIAVSVWRWVGVLPALLLCLGAGCGEGARERREDRNPLVRRAVAARVAQDVDRAEELCRRALKRHADLAPAHLELAMILDSYRQDYAGALYHYGRYLELRPETEQREAVEERVRHCRVAFASEVVSAPREWRGDLEAKEARIRELELEVVRLNEELTAAPMISVPASAMAMDRATATGKGTAKALPKVSATSTPIAVRRHVVKSGENLATISKLYFGTPARWKDIFNANRDQLPDANRIKMGMTLIIPEES